jgi:hypothetical protein
VSPSRLSRFGWLLSRARGIGDRSPALSRNVLIPPRDHPYNAIISSSVGIGILENAAASTAATTAERFH